MTSAIQVMNRAPSAPSMTRWSNVNESAQDAARLPVVQGIRPDRSALGASDAEDRRVGMVNHGREVAGTHAAEIGHGEAAAAEILQAQVAGTGAFGDVSQLDRDLDDVFLVHITNHRHDQSSRSVDGDAEMDIMFEHQLIRFGVDGAVHMRMSLQSGSGES